MFSLFGSVTCVVAVTEFGRRPGVNMTRLGLPVVRP